MKANPKKILLGVTGSIAAYKSAEIIRRLQDKGLDVTVIMTKEAERFITPVTLGSLSGHKVYRDMFEENDSAWHMHHLQLAKEADLLLIAPATANTIAKLACGIADDLLTCVALATEAKIVVAPAMHDEMYRNKIFQKNCRQLKDFGMTIIDPVRGKLACGTVGEGHLADVNDIVKSVVSLIHDSSK